MNDAASVVILWSPWKKGTYVFRAQTNKPAIAAASALNVTLRTGVLPSVRTPAMSLPPTQSGKSPGHDLTRISALDSLVGVSIHQSAWSYARAAVLPRIP